MRNPRKRKQSKSTSKLSYIGLGAVAVIALGLTAFALNQPAPESGAARPAAAITPEPTETLSTLRDSLPAGSNALIIGDSYTQGHAASAGNGYAEVLGRDLGWKTTVNGVGGTGYTAGGGNGGSGTQQFSTRIAELAGPELAPAIVILQGGQNDWRVTPAELTNTVAETAAQVQAAWPSAKVVIVGPSAPFPLSETMGGSSDAIKAGATQAGVPFVDVVTLGWFTEENRPAFAHTDGSHLNTAGHQYLAEQLEAWLASN